MLFTLFLLQVCTQEAGDRQAIHRAARGGKDTAVDNHVRLMQSRNISMAVIFTVSSIIEALTLASVVPPSSELLSLSFRDLDRRVDRKSKKRDRKAFNKLEIVREVFVHAVDEKVKIVFEGHLRFEECHESPQRILSAARRQSSVALWKTHFGPLVVNLCCRHE